MSQSEGLVHHGLQDALILRVIGRGEAGVEVVELEFPCAVRQRHSGERALIGGGGGGGAKHCHGRHPGNHGERRRSTLRGHSGASCGPSLSLSPAHTRRRAAFPWRRAPGRRGSGPRGGGGRQSQGRRRRPVWTGTSGPRPRPPPGPRPLGRWSTQPAANGTTRCGASCCRPSSQPGAQVQPPVMTSSIQPLPHPLSHYLIHSAITSSTQPSPHSLSH